MSPYWSYIRGSAMSRLSLVMTIWEVKTLTSNFWSGPYNSGMKMPMKSIRSKKEKLSRNKGPN